MKKIVLLLILVVGVAIVGPKVIGGIVESEYENIAQELAKDPNIEISERSFTSHWFTGEAITKIKFKGNAQELGDIELSINEQLTFGPFAFTHSGIYFGLAHSDAKLNIETDLASDEAMSKINRLLTEKLSISSVLTYGLNYETTALLDEITYEVDGNKAVIGKLYSESKFIDEKKIRGFVHWDGLTLFSSNKNLLIGAAKVEFDQEVINGDFYSESPLLTGDFLMLLKAITVSDANNNSIVVVDDLSFSGTSEVNDNLIDASINYSVGQFVGQGQSLKNINLAMEFNKFEIQAMEELNKLFASAQANPENMAQYTPELINKASELLKYDPIVNINDFSVETPNGVIKSNASLTIDYSVYDANNPMSIVSALNINAKGQAPFLYLTSLGLEDMVNMYVEQGLLLVEKEQLFFDASFEKGLLTVNGNAIPL